MSELKTSRPFQERFLDGFDRSQLRKEVQRVKPRRRLSGFRKHAAGWGLGATLALGGLGIPLKIGNMLHAAQKDGGEGKTSATNAQAALPDTAPPDNPSATIATDLTAARQIAQQVASGVQGAASTVADTAAAAPAAVAQAPQAVAAVVTQVPDQAQQPKAPDQATEAFFAREVPFGQIIYQEAKKNDLPPELVAAVAHTESKFQPTARSNRGAIGLMQLVPRTGRWLGASNLTDPVQNIQAGAKYLKYLSDRFGGDHQKAIAAYNAGEGNVRRFGGVPPFRETRNYVQRVASFQRDLSAQLSGAIAELNQ